MYLVESRIKVMLSWSKVLFVWGWISSLFWSGALIFATFSGSGNRRRSNDYIIYILIILFFLVLSIIGYLKLFISVWLKNMTKNARFINAYFENDLDGMIKSDELAVVLGISENAVRRQLRRLKRMCMTGFGLEQSQLGTTVLLDSKTVKCLCKKCGGEIEKRIYFAGVCPYCGSLDIFAQVITNDKVYSIQHIDRDSDRDSNDNSRGLNGANSSESFFYITGDADDANRDKEWIRVFINGAFILFIVVCMLLAVRDVLKGDEEASLILGFVLLIMPFIYNAIKHYRNIIYISRAKLFASNAVETQNTTIDPNTILTQEYSLNKKLKAFREMQKRGYIRNCSLIHNETDYLIGLSREIKRDSCPMCGAALKGILADNPRCQFCGYEILNSDAFKRV